jgi:DNA primase
MGGRVIPSRKTFGGKYVNSPETELFKKAKTLYGLRNARDGIKATKTAIVMEGYTDVIIAHQCGVTNAIACLGTAFTQEHIKQLATVADKIIMVLDGDEAGQKRSDAIAEVFLKESTDASIVTIPGGLDPADWILKHGGEAFLRLASSGVSPIQFRINRICQGINIKQRSESASKALDSVIALAAQSEAGYFLAGTIASMFNLPDGVVMGKLAAKKRQLQEKAGPAIRKPSVEIDLNATELLALLVNHPDTAFPMLQERLDRNWLTIELAHVWSVYDSRDVQGLPLDWRSVLESLAVDSIPRKQLEAYLYHLEAAKVRGIPLEPQTPIETRVNDLVNAFSKRTAKEIPFSDLF